ncbi:MAG: efflux RND transporter periplasmic adaptor subunit [Aliidongia sp.]
MRLAGFILLAAMVGAAGWGLGARSSAQAALETQTAKQAITSVVLTKAVNGPRGEDVVLPGTVQSFVDAPIFARTSGYVKAWYTDIGAQVTKGQLLAEIDTPEVDDQLRQAQADLNTAEANGKLADSTAKRWQTLATTDSVSKQENDEKAADASAKAAVVAAAKANVSRLEQLESFKRVVAPFDGVVTARRTDVGALINAGSGVGPELFRVADTSKLRIYVQVPQAYVPVIKTGTTANLRFVEFPGRDFPAKVARTAEAMDPTARTLLVELQVDNSKHELLPGGYTEVHLAATPSASIARLPINTLLFRAEGLRVAKVDGSGNVTLAPVTLGRDFGTEVEIVEGVAPGESVVLNPPDSLREGQPVRVIAAPAPQIADAANSQTGGTQK